MNFPFLTITKAAAKIGVSEATLRRAIAKADLAARVEGGVLWIDPLDLDNYAAARSKRKGTA